MGTSPALLRTPLLSCTLAIAAAVLNGCGVGTTPTASVGGKAAPPQSPVPVPGWADGVVPAGNTAYVVGWRPDQSAALWQVDAAGRLSPRTPPPGMRGNPGLAGAGSVLDLAFTSPEIGLAITGTDGRYADHTVLYATDDGARTWRKIDLPRGEQAAQIAVGHGAAYALTSNCAEPVAACDHATLWSVDPAGRTVPHTFDTLPSGVTTSEPMTLTAYGPHVWVLLGMGAGRGTAVRSYDTGRTWHRFDSGLCVGEKAAATSATVLWATCVTGMLEHFTRQQNGSPVEVFARDVGATSSSTLVPLSDTTAYAIIDGSHGARVEATHDGGRTTNTIAPIPRSIARRGFEATFVSPQVGYLVTANGGQVYRTDDGSKSWQVVNAPRR